MHVIITSFFTWTVILVMFHDFLKNKMFVYSKDSFLGSTIFCKKNVSSGIAYIPVSFLYLIFSSTCFFYMRLENDNVSRYFYELSLAYYLYEIIVVYYGNNFLYKKSFHPITERMLMIILITYFH